MSARDRSPAAIVAAPGSGSFDDVGALLFALRNLLEGAGQPTKAEANHLYCLAAMAEKAWSDLDAAMTGAKQ